jgi:hypothetical protein
MVVQIPPVGRVTDGGEGLRINVNDNDGGKKIALALKIFAFIESEPLFFKMKSMVRV